MASDQNVGIALTANSSAVEKALEKMHTALDRTVDKLNKVEQASTKSSKQAASGFEEAAAAAGNFIGEMSVGGAVAAGMAKAVADISAEWEKLLKRQEQSRVVAQTTAEAVREARVNFVPDATITNSQLEAKLGGVAGRTRSSIGAVSAAASNAFSAGADTNQQALDAVEASLRVLPNNAQAATTLSGRTIDLQQITGEKDPKAVIGYLLNLQAASRVKSLDKLGATAVPTIASVMARGDTSEQAAELFSTLNVMMKDETGEQSATTTKSLATRLAGFVSTKKGKDDRGAFKIPQSQLDAFNAATSTDARIGVMQQSPELRRQFIGNTPFEAGSQAFVEQLLAGSPEAKAAQDRARGLINPLDARQAGLYTQKIGELEAGQFQGVLSAEQQSQQNVEGFQLGQSRAQRTAAVRKILSETEEQTGGLTINPYTKIPFVSGQADFDVPVALGADPVERGIKVMEKRRSFVTDVSGGLGDADKTESVLKLLDEQLKVLKAMQADAKKPQAVEVVNQQRHHFPTRRAASALSAK